MGQPLAKGLTSADRLYARLVCLPFPWSVGWHDCPSKATKERVRRWRFDMDCRKDRTSPIDSLPVAGPKGALP